MMHKKRKADEKETTAQRALGLLRRQDTAVSRPHEEYTWLRKKAIWLITHPRFELLTLALVFANAIQIGASTDYLARNRHRDDSPVSRAFDLLFCFIFALEILMRLFAFRSRFFNMWGWAWNVFDLFVVGSQLVSECVHLWIGKNNGYVQYEGTLLRVLRIVRGVRVARVFKVMSVVEDLQLLVSCILHSFASFSWACALLLIMVYIVSIYLTQFMISEVIDGSFTNADELKVVALYGSLPTAMLSLIQGLLGGLDWKELVDPVKSLSPVVGFVFVLYIVFTMLAILNVITGNFVNTSLDAAKEIKDIHRLTQARRTFITLDFDASGTISLEEIYMHLQDPVVQEFFTSLDIDMSEARSLFQLIDLDDSGYIDFEEFLRGCLRLHGNAKSTDLLLVTRDIRKCFELQGIALQTLEQHLCNLAVALSPTPPKDLR